MRPLNISLRVFALLVVSFAVASCSTVAPRPDYAAIVASPDRSDADRATDKRRQPVKLLQFYGVRRGQRVLDMGASGGYNTELLARAVGPEGTVYAQNSTYILNNFVKGRFEERIKKSGLTNVVHLVRPFDDPVPADVRDLDLVTCNFVYHDTVWLGVDRARMNRAVFNALKPGGIYIVADHSARAGTGVNDSKTLHRIEESVVRREVEAAGFVLAQTADFLRNPEDPRTVQVQKNTIPNDEFVLKFVKP